MLDDTILQNYGIEKTYTDDDKLRVLELLLVESGKTIKALLIKSHRRVDVDEHDLDENFEVEGIGGTQYSSKTRNMRST